jgi:hypothetical protein
MDSSDWNAICYKFWFKDGVLLRAVFPIMREVSSTVSDVQKSLLFLDRRCRPLLLISPGPLYQRDPMLLQTENPVRTNDRVDCIPLEKSELRWNSHENETNVLWYCDIQPNASEWGSKALRFDRTTSAHPKTEPIRLMTVTRWMQSSRIAYTCMVENRQFSFLRWYLFQNIVDFFNTWWYM